MTRHPQKTQEALYLLTYFEEGTFGLGRALGNALMGVFIGATPAPAVTVLISGDLGTGKTVLVRGIGDALGITRVRSPSFTLVNEYHTKHFAIVHADLYRLSPEGVDDLGLEEYRENRCVLLVEWPERWVNQPERDVLKVFIEAGSESGRAFDISSRGGAADLVFQNLVEAIKDGKIDPGVGLQFTLD